MALDPCSNEDCDKCHPLPRWTISTETVERRVHERNIKAATLEEAMRIYNEGTAWPSDYDTRTTEILEEKEPVAVPAPSNAPDADRLWICYNRLGSEEAKKEFLAGSGPEYCDGCCEGNCEGC